jgi:DNA-binding transcriptional MocR family regulator
VIGLEDPAYPVCVALARALGLRVARIPVDEFGITPAGLEAAIRGGAKAIVVVPRAQNPIGGSFDERRARALKRVLASAPDVAVLEDDYLSMVVDVPLHSLSGGRRRWLHVRSLAKSLGPDLRLALFAGDQLTVSRITDRQRIGCGWVSHILQDAAAALLRSPATKPLIAKARRTYTERRRYFLRSLAERGVRAHGDAGFNVWIPVTDEAAAVRAAAAAGFTIDAGARYREQAPPGVRVSITTLQPREADTLAAALATTTGATNLRP